MKTLVINKCMVSSMLNSVSSFVFPMRPLVATSQCRESSEAVPTNKLLAGTERPTSIFNTLAKVLAPERTKSCNECLVDIAREDERCLHCGALQTTETIRQRRRDAGWY